MNIDVQAGDQAIVNLTMYVNSLGAGFPPNPHMFKEPGLLTKNLLGSVFNRLGHLLRIACAGVKSGDGIIEDGTHR